MDRPRTMKDALAGVLTPAELETLITSFDIVGSIAIIDVPSELAAKEQDIAQAVLAIHKHVRTVLKKTEKHDGEFRVRPLSLVLGEDTRETLVRESGVDLLVDVENVYFSVRLSTERLRLAGLVETGENVLVLFSGAAPYVCVIAKHSRASSVLGVEKNPIGHEYALENIRRNKLRTASAVLGDCADLSFLPGRYDRIVLMLPSGAIGFLPQALSVAAPTCTLHIYAFGREEEELPALEEQIRSSCQASGYAVRSCVPVRAGHHAPYVYRWCFDTAIAKGRAGR